MAVWHERYACEVSAVAEVGCQRKVAVGDNDGRHAGTAQCVHPGLNGLGQPGSGHPNHIGSHRAGPRVHLVAVTNDGHRKW